MAELRDELRSSIEEVASKIRDGNVVAFVGAGFAAPIVPDWVDLLGQLNEELHGDAAESNDIHELLAGDRSSRDLEAAAQLLEDYAPDQFQAALRSRLQAVERERGPDARTAMDSRLENLRAIPFKAILTTNFDGLLVPGSEPQPRIYRRLLRDGRPWWDESVWREQDREVPIVHLHGDLQESPGQLVFTRRGYLKRVHGSSDYRPFLRALLMTHTVLFIGFSFTDAYLNELRAEALTVLGGGDGTDRDPLAYAVLDDVPVRMQQYLRNHDGIEPIAIESDDAFHEFDDTLSELRDLTDPERRLARLLSGKRILWVDPNVIGNARGLELLQGAADEVVQVDSVDDATTFDGDVGSFDLVITRWNHRNDQEADGLDVLAAVRDHDHLRAPVVVFASGSHASQNKHQALRHGATAYEYEWSGLFREIERLMATP